MTVLRGDIVEAGSVIGRIDPLDDAATPQPLHALIDQPVERKLKRKQAKRKPRSAFRSTRSIWIGLGMLALVAFTAGLVLFFAPVRSVEVWRQATVPVVVTATAPSLVPTPRFRPHERVIFNDTTGTSSIQWGTQGIVQNTNYEPGAGTWYGVRFGDETVRVVENQLDSVGVLAPTPTMRFGFGVWDPMTPLLLKESVADFPAGTRVFIGSSFFNGIEWEIDVRTENGVTLHVYESQLEAPPSATADPFAMATPSVTPVNPAATPTSRFSTYVGLDLYTVMTTQQIGDVPAHTRVRISSARLGVDGWLYTVIAEDHTRAFEAHESQLERAS